MCDIQACVLAVSDAGADRDFFLLFMLFVLIVVSRMSAMAVLVLGKMKSYCPMFDRLVHSHFQTQVQAGFFVSKDIFPHAPSLWLVCQNTLCFV